jgi:hypothetical protein
LRKYFLPFLTIVLLSSGFECKKNVDCPPIPSVALSLSEVTCTEAFLHLQLSNVGSSPTIVLERNGKTVFSAFVMATDTILRADSLLPGQTYRFVASVMTGQKAVLSSPTIETRSLDSTSHAFTWTSDLLGNVNSELYDVCIINDTLAYAVGDIRTPDTTTIYNLAKWNGNTWSLTRADVLFRGNMITPPLEGCFAFSPTDIWLIGSLPIHGDGQHWEMYDVRAMGYSGVSLSKGWGTSSNDMYFAGAAGSFVHFDGSTWQVISTGTTTRIGDIWGIERPQNGGGETVYCAVGDIFQQPLGAQILKLDATAGKISQVIWNDQNFINSVWTSDGTAIYVAGWGISRNVAGAWNSASLPLYTISRVRGNGNADILLSADGGLINHFNGASWFSVSLRSDFSYTSAAIRGNLAMVVGFTPGQAVVSVGRR